MLRSPRICKNSIKKPYSTYLHEQKRAALRICELFSWPYVSAKKKCAALRICKIISWPYLSAKTFCGPTYLQIKVRGPTYLQENYVFSYGPTYLQISRKNCRYVGPSTVAPYVSAKKMCAALRICKKEMWPYLSANQFFKNYFLTLRICKKKCAALRICQNVTEKYD